MASRPIQIKYSVTNATVPTLIPGELAFTQAGNNFFIGSPDGISGNIRIGHKLHDGILTANEALVSNSTGGIDRLYASVGDIYSINAFSINTNTITTNSISTGTITVSQLNSSNINVTKLIANSSSGTAGYVLTSAGPDSNVYWKQITEGSTSNTYFITSDMYDFRAYNMGFMNIAPNQNVETLGFRTEITIPYGSIWLLAKNTTDQPPVSLSSPGTTITPMMWISVDKSGTYDPITNPNGQDYWFNITPPPSGA
jgi:hypothetical protein